MPTTTERKLTAAKRATEATSQLRGIFGFSDLKLMSIALAEAAVSEARSNSAFAGRVRAAYQDLESTAKSSGKGQRSAPRKHAKPAYTPIIPLDGMNFTMYEALDPQKMLRVLGKEQFPMFLADQMLDDLKAAARRLMEAHPGTKPDNLGRKASLIDYIVKMVAG